MIRFLGDPFSDKIEKVALPSPQPASYAELCETLGWPLESTLIVDAGKAVEDKSQAIKNPQHLTVALIPEGGDEDTVSIVVGVVMIAAGTYFGNPGMIAQGVLTLVGTAWARDQRKKLEAIKEPGQDDFDAISARLNKNQYGQPMPIFIGRGRYSPDMSAPPYQRMEGEWEKPLQITYATYTHGEARGVTFSNLQSGDLKLASTDGVAIKTGTNIPRDGLVDTGAGASLEKPKEEANEPVATYNTKAKATRVEIDIVYAAGKRSDKNEVAYVPFTIETQIQGGEWEPVAFKRLMWSKGLGANGGLGRRNDRLRPAVTFPRDGRQARGGAWDSIKKGVQDYYENLTVIGLVNKPLHDAANDHGKYDVPSSWTQGLFDAGNNKIHAPGRYGTPHRGTLAFDIPDSNAATAVRLTFKVPYEPNNPKFPYELGVEQFRCYYPDEGDYSEQQRVQVQYASDGPWARDLPPLTADFQATVDNKATSNPADWFREFLKQAAFPDSMIDHTSIAEWAAYCVDRKIEYNRVLRGDIRIADLLMSLCEVGHAKLAPIRGKLGVILYDEDMIVREFFLDDQLKSPAMSVTVGRKPKIKGLELAYMDMYALKLVPLRTGTAPYERVMIPGITVPAQAKRELEEAWQEMQSNYPILTFSADDSALDLYRGQRIKVHGQPGVFIGTSICRVLAIKPDENSVQITARVEVEPVNLQLATVTAVPRLPPGGLGPVAKPPPGGLVGISSASKIALNVLLEGGKVYLKMSWLNNLCSGQDIVIKNEQGNDDAFPVRNGMIATREVPRHNQLYDIEFTPWMMPHDKLRSLGSATATASIYVDVNQLIDVHTSAHPKVRGLRLIHTDPRGHHPHEFAGGDCTIGWERLRDYQFYRLRVYARDSDRLLRQEDVRGNQYTYTIRDNKADTSRLQYPHPATRNLRFTVAGIDSQQTTGRVGSIVVFNRPPRKPVLEIYVVAAGYIELKITSTPIDPDFKGYLVWQGDTADFTPTGHRPGEGNCIKSLDANNSGFSVHVPPGESLYFKAAAFDDFTHQETRLNISDAIKASGIKLLDIPEVQSNLKIGWNDLTINDGQSLVKADGTLAYDLGDATPAQRERWQQFIAAGLKGLKPPYKAWHADLIDGAVIKGGSIGANEIAATSIEASHLSSDYAWSGFLSSHEMDVHNIWVNRFQKDANGKPLLDPTTKRPILNTDGTATKLYDYIEGKIEATVGKFQYLEVEMGGLVQTFSRTCSLFRNPRTLLGGNAAGTGFDQITRQHQSVLGSKDLLGLNRSVEIKGSSSNATIKSQSLTGTVIANSRLEMYYSAPQDRSHLTVWNIGYTHVLYIKYAGSNDYTKQYGYRVNGYGADPAVVFYGTPTASGTTKDIQLNDTFVVKGEQDITELWLGVYISLLLPSGTDKVAAVKGLADKIVPWKADLSATCILNKNKNV